MIAVDDEKVTLDGGVTWDDMGDDVTVDGLVTVVVEVIVDVEDTVVAEVVVDVEVTMVVEVTMGATVAANKQKT